MRSEGRQRVSLIRAGGEIVQSRSSASLAEITSCSYQAVPLAGRLDNTRLVRLLGREPGTPLDEAMVTTPRGLGYLGS